MNVRDFVMHAADELQADEAKIAAARGVAVRCHGGRGWQSQSGSMLARTAAGYLRDARNRREGELFAVLWLDGAECVMTADRYLDAWRRIERQIRDELARRTVPGVRQ